MKGRNLYYLKKKYSSNVKQWKLGFQLTIVPKVAFDHQDQKLVKIQTHETKSSVMNINVFRNEPWKTWLHKNHKKYFKTEERKVRSGQWRRHDTLPLHGSKVVSCLIGSVLNHVRKGRGSGVKVSILQPLSTGNWISYPLQAQIPERHHLLQTLVFLPSPQLLTSITLCTLKGSSFNFAYYLTFRLCTPAVNIDYPATSYAFMDSGFQEKICCLTMLFLKIFVGHLPSILWTAALFSLCPILTSNKDNLIFRGNGENYGARENVPKPSTARCSLTNSLSPAVPVSISLKHTWWLLTRQGYCMTC